MSGGCPLLILEIQVVPFAAAPVRRGETKRNESNTMKATTKILITTALVGLFAGSAVAQEQSRGNYDPASERSKSEKGSMKGVAHDPVFKALDTNKDHELAGDELDNAVSSIQALDKDNDGIVSRQELRPGMRAAGERGQEKPGINRGEPVNARDRGQSGQSHSRILKAIDTNKDGELNNEEIYNSVSALKQLDNDGDGKVTSQELSYDQGTVSSPEKAGNWFSKYDQNQDGKITKEELPRSMHGQFQTGDTDGDGALSEDEFKSVSWTTRETDTDFNRDSDE